MTNRHTVAQYHHSAHEQIFICLDVIKGDIFCGPVSELSVLNITSGSL